MHERQYYNNGGMKKFSFCLIVSLVLLITTSLGAQQKTERTTTSAPPTEIESLVDQRIKDIEEVVAKGKSEIAEEKLKLVNAITSTFGLWLAALTLAIAISGGAFFLIVDRMIKTRQSAFEKEFGKDLEDVKKNLENALKEFNAALLVTMGHVNWQDGKLEHAIQLTEGALNEKPPSEATQAMIKSNLAYYYAQAKIWENRHLALEYSTFARNVYYKFQTRTAWIANDVYVSIMFAETPEELEKAEQLARQVKLAFPQLAQEMDGYLHHQVQQRRTEIK